MKTKAIITILFLLAGAFPANAGIIELDLFDLGCPAEFNESNFFWYSEFDLGITFSEITSVHIDWSGQLYAALLQGINDPEPYPTDVSLLSYFDWLQRAEIKGAAGTYPAPEQFAVLSEFVLYEAGGTWDNLLDGTGTIHIGFPLHAPPPGGSVIDNGSVLLNGAVLVIDGTVIPEPSTLLLLSLGAIILKRKR